MSIKSSNRISLGVLLRKQREKRGWNRSRLQKESGIPYQTIINLEHGTPNPTREDFLRIIKVLGLNRADNQSAMRMLSIIHPKKNQRFKFHLPFSLRHPNR